MSQEMPANPYDTLLELVWYYIYLYHHYIYG